jgi:hypothetical protein
MPDAPDNTLSYAGPAPRFNRRIVARCAAVLLAMFLIPIAIYAFTPTFVGTRICMQCGATSRFTEYRIATISWGETSNPLHRVLSRHHSLDGHPHHWAFASGGDPRERGTIHGPAQNLCLNFVQNPEAVSFFDNLLQCTDATTVDHYRRLAFDLQISKYDRFGYALIYARFPDNGFSDPPEFKKWWTEHRAELDAALATPHPLQSQ